MEASDPPAVPPAGDSPPPAKRPAEPAAAGTLGTLFAKWHAIPLYLRILGGVALGVLVGVLLGDSAAVLDIPSKLVLRLLGALAAPLILLAVIQALMHAVLPAGSGIRLVTLLITNTLVAIFIGLLVANVVQPGNWVKIEPETERPHDNAKPGPMAQFLENIPKSLVGPLTDEGKVLSVIFLALAFGIALRRLKDHSLSTVSDFVEVAFRALITILHWVIEVIPLAVFGIVASIIGVKGFKDFVALGGFVLAVMLALTLHTGWYLARVRFGSWVRPLDLLRGMRDALVMAFSTSSSTATMPVTYACLRERVGVRERSASLGALVGANFNNDGTALYEAMSALFISQMTGKHLTLVQQLLVVVTSVIASVGAAGIPEAGLVTMTMVFNAVDLDTKYIAVLLTVDWFLDRCRTTVNVLGDVNVACLLDGHERELPHDDPADEELRALA
ncbi:MAG: dicarboxylate/amino acid:cation symporter [Pirellulales bacterium]